MKFAINAGLLLATKDGANIEIIEEVGERNAFLFGITSEEVTKACMSPLHLLHLVHRFVFFWISRGNPFFDEFQSLKKLFSDRLPVGQRVVLDSRLAIVLRSVYQNMWAPEVCQKTKNFFYQN